MSRKEEGSRKKGEVAVLPLFSKGSSKRKGGSSVEGSKSIKSLNADLQGVGSRQRGGAVGPALGLCPLKRKLFRSEGGKSHEPPGWSYGQGAQGERGGWPVCWLKNAVSGNRKIYARRG